MKRFVRTVGLLTLFLFLLSASIGVTLDRIETAPDQNCLTIYGPGGELEAEYNGNLARLAAIGSVPPARLVPRAQVQIDRRWL